MAKVGTLGDETGYPEPGEPSRTGLRRFPRHARGAWRPLGEERDGVGENSRTGGPKRRRIVVLEEGTGRRCHGNNPTAWARGGPPSRVEGECEEAVKGYVYRCGPGEEDQTYTRQGTVSEPEGVRGVPEWLGCTNSRRGKPLPSERP